MSRIGKKPVEIPKGVKVSQDHDAIKVEGPNGALTQQLPPGIEIRYGGERAFRPHVE